MKKSFFWVMVFLLLTVFVKPVLAYVMQGQAYRIQMDSINFAGGLASSTSYIVEDTVGEVASGPSVGSDFNLYAGYQQMEQNTTISLSIPAAVNMEGTISGISGGTANGDLEALVSTNNRSGYSLYVKANSDPAMQAGEFNFANYAPAGGAPDYDWQVPATASAFGFTAKGTDVAPTFKDNNSVCGQGDNITSDKCWDGFSNNDYLISRSVAANPFSNATTTLSLKAESGNQHIQVNGDYQAVLTLTATVN